MKKKKETPGELIFGLHPILELLKARRRKIISLYTTRPEPKGFRQIEQLLGNNRTPIQYVSRDVLTRMVDSTDHQGFVAWVGLYPYRKKMFDPKNSPVLVLLDGIQDPRNVGAIIRSAYCAGVSGVILTKKQSSPLTPTAIKASAGLSEHSNIMVYGSTNGAVDELKKAGYTLYLATFGGKDIATVQFKTPLCIVIGSEGTGISPMLNAHGIKVTIPQKTEDISYNASVAAGITFFAIMHNLNN